MSFFLFIFLVFSPSQAEVRFRGLEMKGIYYREDTGDISLNTFVQDDQINDVTFDASGNMYVAGYTKSNFSGTSNLGFSDCYVAKYNSSGTLTWRQQLGTSLFDSCQAVTVDAASNVFVAGITQGVFTGQSSYGNLDAFVIKLDSSGSQLWVEQFGTSGTEAVNAMHVDGSNRPVTAGSTTGTLPGATSLGGQDGFVIRQNTNNGNIAVAVQIGTASDDEILDISLDASNRWWVAGYTSGTFTGQTSLGGIDAFFARYSNAGVLSFVRQIGSTADDYATGATPHDINTNPVVVGTTEGTILGEVSAGGEDVFIAEYNVTGTQQWLTQAGTASNDGAQGACAETSGTNYYFAGTTNGAFSGESNAGGSDIFIMKYSGAGVLQWVDQFGSTVNDNTSSMICTAAGVSYIGGRTSGSLPTFSNAGGIDSFFARYTAAGARDFLLQYGGL